MINIKIVALKRGRGEYYYVVWYPQYLGGGVGVFECPLHFELSIILVRQLNDLHLQSN